MHISRNSSPNELDDLQVKWETIKAPGGSKTLGDFMFGDDF